jgi:hypothetical protein
MLVEETVETVCPYCDQFSDVPDEIEGTRTLCRFCEQIFTADRVFVLVADQTNDVVYREQAL